MMIERLDIPCINHICNQLRDPNEIIMFRKIYMVLIEKRTTNITERVQKVVEFIRDPFFWRGFFKSNFTRKAPELFKKAPFLEDGTCREVCKLAARYYKFRDPFNSSQSKKKLIEDEKLIHEAIQLEYEIPVDRLSKQINYSFEIVNNLLNFCFCMKGTEPFTILFKTWWPKMKLDIQKFPSKDQSLNQLLFKCSYLGVSEVITELLASGANLEARTSINLTALHLATSQGHVESLKVLIKAGANIGADNLLKNNTALHLAARCDQVEILNALISAGANIEAKNQQGVTPLHYAALFGHVEALKALIKAGADLTAKSLDGKQPLNLAIDKGHSDAEALIRTSIKKRLSSNKEGPSASKRSKKI